MLLLSLSPLRPPLLLPLLLLLLLLQQQQPSRSMDLDYSTSQATGLAALPAAKQKKARCGKNTGPATLCSSIGLKTCFLARLIDGSCLPDLLLLLRSAGPCGRPGGDGRMDVFKRTDRC